MAERQRPAQRPGLETAVRAFIVALALVSTVPAQAACHKFSIWKYPKPQRCGIIYALAARPAPKLAIVGEERVSIEITVTPELLETWARQDALERLKDEIK